MGLLERWDRRNQRVLEGHNRRYKAEQAAGGGSGAGGVYFAGRGVIDTDPWFIGFGISLLVVALVLFLLARRDRAAS